MLRWTAIALVAANVLFFGYARGWFDGPFGLRSTGDREPERLLAQVRPESVLLLPLPASGAAASATRCLEIGPLLVGDLAAAEAALRGVLPEGSWRDVRNDATTPPTHALRVDAADPAAAARLAELRLGAAGRSFVPCER